MVCGNPIANQNTRSRALSLARGESVRQAFTTSKVRAVQFARGRTLLQYRRHPGDQKCFSWFRPYGPEMAVFDKSFKLPDTERIR